MQRIAYAAACALLSASLCGPLHAQQQISWKQTVNTPKGLNLPKDVKGEMLGIELGDTYTEARAKLEALRLESSQSPQPLRETTTQFQFRLPGNMVTVAYPGELAIYRYIKASAPQGTSETIKLRFSAPSSGQQVVGITRTLGYEKQDQPRISEVLASLQAKYRAQPVKFLGTKYLFIFDSGQNWVPPKPPPGNMYPCYVQIAVDDPATINQTGRCDIVLQVEFEVGMTEDHARGITFTFGDNERAKLNLTADTAFMRSYVQSLQSGGGAAPKL